MTMNKSFILKKSKLLKILTGALHATNGYIYFEIFYINVCKIVNMACTKV